VPNGFHLPAPAITPRVITRNKKITGAGAALHRRALHIPSSMRSATSLYVLNTVLGGGMSSRLFQKIREEQGLVYSIYSDLNPYRDTGCLAIYAGTSLESTRKVVDSVLAEFRELKADPIPEDELRRAKDQLKGSLM